MGTPAERNLAAEVRAVEEGHRALLNGRIPVALPASFCNVVSDTKPGKRYQVRASASPAGPIIFTCEPQGRHAYEDDHLGLTGEPGIVCCKHAAVAARRLEREGLARLDATTGCWVDTRGAEPVDPTDPTIFEGLNR